MSIENNFLSDFLWKLLGNSWDFYKNRNEANAFWDGELHKLSNLYLQGVNVDAGKGLFTVPIEPKTERHLFIFNDDTETTPNEVGAVIAYTIDTNITTIPFLEDNFILEPTVRLLEGADYIVSAGIINFMIAAPPQERMWSYTFRSNREQIRNNFGRPVNFERTNSLEYLFGTQGMWYALWNGPAVRRVGVGLQILLGLTFARAGNVLRVEEFVTGDYEVEVRDPTRGNADLAYAIPSYLEPVVTQGEDLLEFSRLSNGVEIRDWVNDPELTALVVVPHRNEYHTWVIKTLAEVIWAQIVLSGASFEFSEVVGFVDTFKPEYTDFVIALDVQLHEFLFMGIEGVDVDLLVDLTSKTNFNYWNFTGLPGYVTENGIDEAWLVANPWPGEQVHHLDDENVKFVDDLALTDMDTIVLSELVSDDENYVNYLDDPNFEAENGITEADYHTNPSGTYPAFDPDNENVKYLDVLEITEGSVPGGATLVIV